MGKGGSCKLEVGEAGASVTYSDLHELVMDCERLKTLYPNVPKEQVFGDRVAWEPPTPISRFSGAFGGDCSGDGMATTGGGGAPGPAAPVGVGWARYAGPD